MGNPRLKGAGVQIEFDEHQLTEWIKCKIDPIYFIENYIKIVTIDYGLQPMKLHPFQKDIVLSLHNNSKTLGVMGRQLGKTTCVAAYFCHYMIFNKSKQVGILANKAATSREILSRIQLAYEHLPFWLQQGVTEWNKGSFALENGSKIMASSTSSSAIRGFTFHCLLLDEFAFVPNNIADDFFASVYPTISSGKTSKLAIVSTPKGMNHFYKLVMEAESKLNDFNLIKADWRSVPGRTQEWANAQKAVLGEMKYAQEMEIQFIGGTDTLISGTKLKAIPITQPIFHSEFLKVYEEPVLGNSYVMTVDTSRGTGGDYSAFIIFNVTQLPYKVAAVYRNNKISSMLYPGLIFKIASEYNDAAVLIETNDIGEGVANSLFYEFEYEMTMMSTGGVVSSYAGLTPGLKTTKKTKAIGCDNMKQLVEGDKVIINDHDLLYELSNFVAKGASYEADSGNDDLAMCLCIFSYLTTQPAMEDLTSSSAKQQIISERLRAAEEEMLPVGFLSDGLEDQEGDRFYF